MQKWEVLNSFELEVQGFAKGKTLVEGISGKADCL